jgi:hypothetical protein
MNTYHNEASEIDVWRDSALSETTFNKRKGDISLSEGNVEISEGDAETQLKKRTCRGHKSKVKYDNSRAIEKED